MAKCFLGVLRYPKRAKPNIFLNLGLMRRANMGLSWLRSSVALGACLGAGRGFLGASAQIVHQRTKIAPFRLFGAIAFPRCLQISVLRAFLGGFFGFIGSGCIFGWLVAFVGLVGLYACSVRRLKVRKRKPANFLALAFSLVASLLLLLIVVCLVVIAWVASLLLFVCFGWVVGRGSFSLRMIATKRKGAPCWRVLSLFVGCVLFYHIALGITKLLQAVSILKELPTIHAAVNWSLL